MHSQATGGGATDSNKYFAPISPASNTTNANNLRLLELIQRAGGKSQVVEKFLQQQQNQNNIDTRSLLFLLEQQQKPSGLNSPSLSQMPSVEELESRLRQTNPPNDLSPNPSTVPRIITSNNSGPSGIMPPGPSSGGLQQPLPDINAFKRLIAQMSDVGGTGGANANNPMVLSMQLQQQQQALMQMLSNKQNPPQNAEEMKQQMFALMKAMQPQQQGPPPQMPQGRPIQGQGKQQTPQQQQTEALLQNMLHMNQVPPHMQTHLQPNMNQTEILKRPEAQLIIQNLIRGDIKQQTLWQQLSNPATTPRQREVINAVLSTVNGSPRGNSPNILIPPGGAPIPIPPIAHPDLQAQLLLQQKQPMRVSPLPNGK